MDLVAKGFGAKVPVVTDPEAMGSVVKDFEAMALEGTDFAARGPEVMVPEKALERVLEVMDQEPASARVLVAWVKGQAMDLDLEPVLVLVMAQEKDSEQVSAMAQETAAEKATDQETIEVLEKEKAEVLVWDQALDLV